HTYVTCLTPLQISVTSYSFTTTPSPFFCSAPPPHRYLPSFPTRRSSDLAAIVSPAKRRGVLFQALLASLANKRQGTSATKNRSRDRKSTRLNSSHVAISYAVFCLKKKKKVNRRQNIDAQRNSTAHDMTTL